MKWEFESMAKWRLASSAKDAFGKECDLVGLSPTGAAAELGTSQQRIYHLIKRGYLDVVHINERGRLMVIMVTNESLKRFRENPNPKPGPKQDVSEVPKVTIREFAKWVAKGMYQELKSGRLMSDEECRKWLENTPGGKDFRKRLRDQYGPAFDSLEDKIIATAVKLGLKKSNESEKIKVK